MAYFDSEASRLRFRQIAQAVSAHGNDRSTLGRPFEDDPIEVDGRKLGVGIMRALNREGLAVSAPTGQICTVLPLKYDETGSSGNVSTWVLLPR